MTNLLQLAMEANCMYGHTAHKCDVEQGRQGWGPGGGVGGKSAKVYALHISTTATKGRFWVLCMTHTSSCCRGV